MKMTRSLVALELALLNTRSNLGDFATKYVDGHKEEASRLASRWASVRLFRYCVERVHWRDVISRSCVVLGRAGIRVSVGRPVPSRTQ
jgi:hypothetical protein